MMPTSISRSLLVAATAGLTTALLGANPGFASVELTVLSTADPCDCDGAPFPWSYNDVWGFEKSGSEFALLGSYTGIYIYDVTNPTNPIEVAFIAGPNSNWRDMKMLGDTIFATHEIAGGGLQVIDVSDPANPTAISVNDWFETAHNLYVDEATQRAYIFGANGPEIGSDNNPILDISNPTAPTLVGNYTDRYFHDGYVRDNTLYGAKIYTDGIHGSGLYILDVTNPAVIDTLGIATWPSAFCHNTWTTEDGVHCLTTDENLGGHVRVWNVQDPSSITPTSEYSLGDDIIVHNVFVKGSRAYVSYYWQGVRVVDLSDIMNPLEIGFYDTAPEPPTGDYGGCWGVYPFLPSGTILASDVTKGLFVLADIATASVGLDPLGVTPSRTLLTGIAPNPFNPATTVSFDIPEASPVRLTIYDVNGRLVTTLHDGPSSAGAHQVDWNGRDASGRTAASGTYYIRLETPARIETRPAVMLK